jgi:hypothetical protein
VVYQCLSALPNQWLWAMAEVFGVTPYDERWNIQLQ